ncbi:sensor histidine kinase [Alteromonas sediminis]|uniref:histidine kinase n=1 Tax=Alteromonas sediminis TaxID=2259342 RepID=A0A3N5Y4J2_9ALTE|nr:HAMP domain-containing sensor histidine kinase [Alteromonas sediminis]RPJ68480.1 sensor histidine kinase [Alteromonas sediminis]
MSKRTKRYHSLSRRIVLQFCLFTLVLSLVYSAISIVMMYALEDSFIERGIEQEAQQLASEYARTGQWPQPSRGNYQLHFSRNTFPEEIRQLALDHPKGVEFSGKNNRHYHILEIEGHKNTYLLAEVSNELYVRPIREGIITFLAIYAALVTLIACVIAWYIGRKTARPLTQLAALVDGVEPEQIPMQFADKFPNNEVGILADTLEASLKRMVSALEREKCFTRDVSHELRTPLAVIKNAVELLSSSPSVANSDGLKRIEESAEQMEKTVHTLLMLAREAHSAEKKEDTQLMALVERSVLNHSTLLAGKHVDVVIDDSCNTRLPIQAGMLSVLLDNLISNAFQYTHSGEVVVSFAQGTLIVKDTGQGIEEAISTRITEPAVKGSESTGFGFGMSIVKRLCEHQGWTMQVTSHSGTTVRVTLT